MTRRWGVLAVVVAVLGAVGLVGVVAVAQDDGRRPGMGMAGSVHGLGQSVDVRESAYLAEMVAHHREAVAAARELARSDRAEMREFGASIVKTQSAQIRQMRTWLADWFPEQSTSVDYQPMMRDLTGLSGDDLDHVFLEDMIGHHMAAVMLSQHLLARGTEHQPVATLAQSIRDEQRAEIAQMRLWLSEWFDEDALTRPGCPAMRGSPPPRSAGWGRYVLHRPGRAGR